MLKKIVLIAIALPFFAQSQVEIEDILESGLTDTQTMLQHYFKPFATGFGYGVNGGWYNTARTHNGFGIDIQVIGNLALVPQSEETFTFNNADYTNIKLFDNSRTTAELPTAFGSKELEDRPMLTYTDDDGNSVSTSALPGFGTILEDNINYNAVPSAMVQLGVGLFKNTDLKLRFVPNIQQDDFEFSAFGIGIMHDIKQWLPFMKESSIDLSALVAFNNIKSKVFLDPDDNPDQAVQFNTKTTLISLLASKKLAFLTIYGGVGHASFNSDLNLLGTYVTDNNRFVDPIMLNYKSSSFRGNVGLSMKLWILNLGADYAFQEFNTLTASVGFNFDNYSKKDKKVVEEEDNDDDSE